MRRDASSFQGGAGGGYQSGAGECGLKSGMGSGHYPSNVSLDDIISR